MADAARMLLTPFEKTIRYYRQRAARALRTRRKNQAEQDSRADLPAPAEASPAYEKEEQRP